MAKALSTLTAATVVLLLLAPSETTASKWPQNQRKSADGHTTDPRDAKALAAFINAIAFTHPTWNTTNDACATWEGVVCSQLQPGGYSNVVGLQWQHMGLGGDLRLSLLPTQVRDVLLQGNKFSCSVDLTQLPPAMIALNLTGNSLQGAVDLTKLPEGFQYLYLSGNRFSGSLDLGRLPRSMTVLEADDNNFGDFLSFDFGLRQTSLRTLSVRHNQISCGALNFGNLPPTLNKLHMASNQLSGDVNLTALPKGLVDLDLSHNYFSGPVDARYPPEGATWVLSYNTFNAAFLCPTWRGADIVFAKACGRYGMTSFDPICVNPNEGPGCPSGVRTCVPPPPL